MISGLYPANSSPSVHRRLRVGWVSVENAAAVCARRHTYGGCMSACRGGIVWVQIHVGFLRGFYGGFLYSMFFVRVARLE